MKKNTISALVALPLLCSAAIMNSCQQQTKQVVADNEKPTATITWIEDQPGPSLHECQLFPEVSDSLWAALGLEEGVSASMSCFLLQTEDKNILFDTGLGAPSSQLTARLQEIGLTPDSIDLIYLTHLHGDHIGGMMKEGKTVFKKAEVYVNRLEAEAWNNMTDDKSLQAKEMLAAYKNQLHLFEAGDTLEHHIITMAAYGHTPGHTAFQKDSLLIVGDLMHGVALQMEHPEYCARYDMNQEDAVAARKKIMEYARKNGLTMYGMHFPNGKEQLTDVPE